MTYDTPDLNKNIEPEKDTTNKETSAMDELISSSLTRLGLNKTLLSPGLSVEELITLLEDSSWQVRVAAAQHLGELFDTLAVPALVQALQDAQPEVRAAAARALGKLHESVPPEALVALLTDTEEINTVKVAAAWALGEIGTHAAHFLDILLPLFKDTDQYVRATAIRAVGKMSTSAPVQPLVDALKDPASHVREMAAEALGNQEDWMRENDLIALIDDPSPEVSRAAAKALGNIWTTSQAEFIQKVTSQSTDELTPEVVPVQYDKEPPVHHHGNVEFLALEPTYFQSYVPLLAQAPDNQWIPRTLLQAIFSQKISYEHITGYLHSLVRTEYIRSLINGKQVIMNRAYLYNNPVISNDYQPDHPDRDAFKALLQSGAIIPFFFTETSPDEEPRFETDTRGFSAWKQVVQEVQTQCLRFSWENEENQRKALRQLSGRFHEALTNFATRDLDTYLIDLQLPADSGTAFKKRLMALARKCLEELENDHHITRNIAYKEFITAGDPTKKLYDPTKPFASEMKQLIDLAYNSNLADALNGYLLTPADSLPRPALQELQTMQRGSQHVLPSAVDLIDLARKDAFAILQEGLYLRSMGLLSLRDVLEIRRMDEWLQYTESLEKLLREPYLFEPLATSVYTNYMKLARRMTELVERRHLAMNPVKHRVPVAELTLDIGGATVTIKRTSEQFLYEFSGLKTPHTTEGGQAVFVARIGISDQEDKGIWSNLFTHLDFMHGKLNDALAQWEEIRARLKEAFLFKEITEETEDVKNSATISE